MAAKKARPVEGIELSWPELLRDSAYIAGEWMRGGEPMVVENPATGAVLATVPRLGAAETAQAVAAASRALPAWRAKGAAERARILKRWHALVLEHAEDLARLITAEQGKPMVESRAEINSSAGYIEWFAEEARRVYGETIPGHMAEMRLTVTRQPVGVVAAITPWNFPSSMLARKVAPALAVGCTMVLKPSELTPLSALALARLGEEAGVPPGVLNVVTGDPQLIGAVLTTDPRIRKFSFTGSTQVGKRLAARCMETAKRVSLELGGNAPFIVFDDADLDAAVEGALASKFRNAGQTCVCANRILVQSGVHDAFVERLAAAAAALPVGDGFREGVLQGPLISTVAVARVQRHVEDARRRGAQLVTGGLRRGESQFHDPTVLTGVTPEMSMFRDEIFGPVAGVTAFETEAEALTVANGTRAGLAAYLYTAGLDRAARVSEALEYGMVGLNTGMLTTEVAPFGGIKESGFGREGSRHGIDDYLDMKYLCSRVAQTG